jgi:carboxymethylenebutenolidase
MIMLVRPEGASDEDLVLSRRGVAAGALGGLFFAGYAPAALAVQAKPLSTDTQGLVVEDVTYPAPDGFQLPAFVARPAGDGPFPVVIVVSEIFGVHEYIRDVCRRIAKAGHVGIAPAFFVREEDPAPLTDMQRIQRIVAAAGYEQVMGDVSATLDWSSQQLWAQSERAAITGFCWGGKVVWQACARFAQFDAGIAWYGRLAPAAEASSEQIQAGRPWPVELADDLKCPVLGLYGAADRGIPLDTVERMREALARASQTESEIVVYPGAPHGFHADYRESYSPEPAADGWRRSMELLERRLKA